MVKYIGQDTPVFISYKKLYNGFDKFKGKIMFLSCFISFIKIVEQQLWLELVRGDYNIPEA